MANILEVTHRRYPRIAFCFGQNGPMASSHLSIDLRSSVSRVVVIGDVRGLESDAIDTAAVGPDRDVVAHPRAATVRTRVPPFVRSGRESGTVFI